MVALEKIGLIALLKLLDKKKSFIEDLINFNERQLQPFIDYNLAKERFYGDSTILI